MKGGENMSVTKTAYDHSYYYLQRAKELHRRDVITHKVRGAARWDDLPRTSRDYYEDLARKLDK